MFQSFHQLLHCCAINDGEFVIRQSGLSSQHNLFPSPSFLLSSLSLLLYSFQPFLSAMTSLIWCHLINSALPSQFQFRALLFLYFHPLLSFVFSCFLLVCLFLFDLFANFPSLCIGSCSRVMSGRVVSDGHLVSVWANRTQRENKVNSDLRFDDPTPPLLHQP